MGDSGAAKAETPDSSGGAVRSADQQGLLKRSASLVMLAIGAIGAFANLQAWLAGQIPSKGLTWLIFLISLAVVVAACVMVARVSARTGKSDPARGQKDTSRLGRVGRIAYIMSACIVTVAALVAAVFTIRALLEKPIVSLSAVSPRTHVSRSHGFSVSGTAQKLGPDSVWIMDYDGGYTVDSQAVVIGSSWSATNSNLGNAGERFPFPLTFVSVLANPSCAAILTREADSPSDYLNALPAGCTAFGKAQVIVTRP
jgi:hypothetical protein